MSMSDEILTWKRVVISPHIWEIAAASVFCVFRVYQLPNGTCWFRCDLVGPKASGLRDAARLMPASPLVAHVQRHIPLVLPVEVAPDATVSALKNEATPLENVQAVAQRRHTKLLKVLADYKALPPEDEAP